MKMTISAGHTPDGMGSCGAVGYIKESTEARKIVESAKGYLKEHTVYDCTDKYNHTKSENLRYITNQCNKHSVDIHASVHLNACKKVKADGKTKGVEVLITGNFDSAKEKAEQICKNISALGFTNRGVKIRKDLYFLNQTKGASLLVECLFVDDEDDYKLYKKVGSEAIGKAIAYGLQGKDVPKEAEKVYSVQVGAYKQKKNAEAMLKKLEEAGFKGIIK